MRDRRKNLSKLANILTREEYFEYSSNNEVLIDIAYECLDLGEFQKAFKIFCMILRLHGEDPDCLNGIGVALCELGRLKTSRSILEKTAQLYPDDPITLANIAGLYWEEDNFEKAVYYYTKSINEDPLLLETYFNLINLYYEFGQLLMAYITCLNVLKLDPENEQAKELCNDLILDIGLTNY